MSTNSTELTFVRCPSCRSLVPAISTRCRMCGAALEASAKPTQETAEEKKAPRVRQHTQSEPGGEFDETIQMAREESGQTEEDTDDRTIKDVLGGETGGEELHSDDDPLKAYVEEMAFSDDSGDEGGPTKEAAMPAEESSSGQSNENEDGPDHMDAFPSAVSTMDEPQEDDDVASKKTQIIKVGGKIARSEAEKAEPAEKPVDSAVRPRVVVESGNRRQGRGLSFGRPRDETGRGDAPSDSGPRARDARQGQRQGDRYESREVKSGEDTIDNKGAEMKGREGEYRASERSHLDSGRESGTRREENPKAKLFGWLVSYAKNALGAAIEFREGRFFVSRTALKPTDLVLDEDAISVPHALVSASVAEGLRLQDMMSERGLFIRRRGTDDYQRSFDVVKVEHGDWVKFGDVEFQVCLIPDLGGK